MKAMLAALLALTVVASAANAAVPTLQVDTSTTQWCDDGYRGR